MSLADRQHSLIEDLNIIQDPHERLAALSSYVSSTALPEELKTDAFLVPGCVSRVWVQGQVIEGLMAYRCAADSPMVKNLVALLCHLYTGATPSEVVAIEPEVWQACGLHKLLSPTRMHGLTAVRARIQSLAAAQLN